MFASLLLLPALIASSYAQVYAVDSSTLVPESDYATALSEGFTKAIIRGYEEACSVGGEVDPNFVGSYNNAVAAGYTDIDTYWYPCNGSGNDCQSYAAQLSELGATFSANSMSIGTIWVDLEQDSICNNVSYLNRTNQRIQVVTLMGIFSFTVELWRFWKYGSSARFDCCHTG